MGGDFILNWLATTPSFAAPYLLAALGLMINERAGVLNLGCEGIMLIGAMTAAIVSFHTGSAGFGIPIAMLAGALVSLIFGVAVVIFRTDQVLTGLIIVAFGDGLTGVVGRPYMFEAVAGFRGLDMGALSDIPWIGPIVFQQDILVYATVVLAIGIWWGLHKSNIGLRLRSVGEDPATADISGVNIQVFRLTAVVLGGAMCGLAGAYISLATSYVWIEHMVAGRGWIVIALVIFAGWRPGRAVIGALIFGGAEALIPRIQAMGFDVPIYIVGMLPYMLTLAVLIVPTILRGEKSPAPSSLLLNYLRQDRR
jgi:general nucleoside transport system permease protein